MSAANPGGTLGRMRPYPVRCQEPYRPRVKRPEPPSDACPFCGNPDPEVDEVDVGTYALCCQDCGALGPRSTTSPADALHRWRTRRVS